MSSLSSLSILRRPRSDDEDDYLNIPAVYDRMRLMRLRATRLKLLTSQYAVALTAKFPGQRCNDDIHSLITTMLHINANLERVLDLPESRAFGETRAFGDVEALKNEVERNEAEYKYAVELHRLISTARNIPPLPREHTHRTPDVLNKMCIILVAIAVAIAMYNVLVF